MFLSIKLASMNGLGAGNETRHHEYMRKRGGGGGGGGGRGRRWKREEVEEGGSGGGEGEEGEEVEEGGGGGGGRGKRINRLTKLRRHGRGERVRVKDGRVGRGKGGGYQPGGMDIKTHSLYHIHTYVDISQDYLNAVDAG